MATVLLQGAIRFTTVTAPDSDAIC